LNVSFTISNPRDSPYELSGGNVDATTNFNVRVRIYETSNVSNEVYTNTFQISDNLIPDASVSQLIQWPAYEHSGFYTVEVTADYNDDILECNEADNIDSDTFELKAITIPYVYIDGNLTNNFSRANIPYNITVHMENSDGDTLSNATVRFVENNSLSLTAPTQIYNHTVALGVTDKSGIIAQTSISFKTDFYGNNSFTFIPTYNSLYLPRYNYTDLDEYIGNYSLYMEGEESDGESFKFIENEILKDNYPFNILEYDYLQIYQNKDLPHESFVSQAMDFVYQTFANFLRTVNY